MGRICLPDEIWLVRLGNYNGIKKRFDRNLSKGKANAMLQIGLLIWGIVILVKQEVKLSKVVKGGPAIAIGILFVATLPLAFAVGLVLGLVLGATGGQEAVDAFMSYAFFLDIGLIVLVIVVAFIIAGMYGKHPHEFDRPYKANSGNPFADPNQQQGPIDTTNPYSAPRDDKY